jgi:hypothetical protein
METFILFLSGFKKEIIDECKVDKFHALIIGHLLLIVGIYAILAWTFFFQTVFIGFIPILAGLFMGSFIVCFDRSLIASMSAKNKTSIWAIIFRLLLAILLGIFLSQPMILRFYKSDIDREAEILMIEKNQEHQQKLDSLYLSKLAPLTKEHDRLHSELETEKLLVATAEADFKVEMDGSGGTKQKGYERIARKKEKLLDDHQRGYRDLKEELDPKINKIRHKIDSINNLKIIEYDSFRSKNTISGTLIQVEALKSLIQKDKTQTLGFRYYILSIILTLIELSALIAKLFFKTTSYQSKISFITETEVRNSESNKNVSLEISQEFEDQRKNSLRESIQSFFNKTKPINEIKLDEMIDGWKTDKEVSYRDLCQLFMDKLAIQWIGLNKKNNVIVSEPKINYRIINSFFYNFYVLMAYIIICSLIFLYFISHYAEGTILLIISIIVTIIDISTAFWKWYLDDRVSK